MRPPLKVGIIGAGISGLATAYFLRKEALRRGVELQMTVLERSSQLGGVIRTEKAGNFLLEGGPDCFTGNKPAVLDLIQDLGLSDALIGCNNAHRRTFLAHRGRLEPLPDGMAFVAPVRWRDFWSTSLISTRGKIRALLEPLVGTHPGDVSVRSFLERRLGKELTEKVAEPLISAVYGGNIDRLSAPSLLPELYAMEQRFGSLWRGFHATLTASPGLPAPFLTFRPGMSRLIERLAENLSSVSIVTRIQDIKVRSHDRCYAVSGSGFEDVFDRLVLSTPAPASADMLDFESGHLASVLKQIPYRSTTVVYLAYKRSEFSHPLNGFGFVVPQEERSVLNACTWVSSKFEERCPGDHVLLRCAIHDERRQRTLSSEAAVAERADKEIRRRMGISCSPIFFRVFQNRKAMPQLTVGHSRRISQLKATLSHQRGLFVSGAFLTKPGIPDCVTTARDTVEAILRSVTGAELKIGLKSTIG